VAVRLGQNTIFRSAQSSADQAVLTVAVEPVAITKLHRHLKVNGTVSAWDPLTIGSEIGGLRIATVPVEEGDVVSKGQVLATLNASLLQAQLEKEQALLERARVNVEKQRQPNRPMDLARLKAAVAQATAEVAQKEAGVVRAKSSLKNAEVNTDRYKALRAEGAVSAMDLDNKTMMQETAQADLRTADESLVAARFVRDQAMERLKLAQEGGMREDIEMARSEFAEKEATVKHIRAQLAQTVIKAPTHGLIVKRLAHIGDITVANEDMFQMVRENRFEVRAQIPEQDLSILKPGQKVEFSSAASGDAKIIGTIREMSPSVDSDTRLATARIDIPYERGYLPGMFVSGITDLGEVAAVAVPSTAVLDKDGRKIVYVLQGNKVFSRAVKVGESTNNFLEILSGVEQGEQVVTRGGGFLKDGDIVRVSQEGTAAAPEAKTNLSETNQNFTKIVKRKLNVTKKVRPNKPQ
jgi:RND family efflux transporter, MFP subunit